MTHSLSMDMVFAPLAFIDGLGAPEMMLIFILVLVLFGGKKLPEFARSMGKTMREFKKAAAGVEEEFKRALEEDERKQTQLKLEENPSATPTPALPEAAGPDTSHDHYDHDYHAHDYHAEEAAVTDVTATPVTPAVDAGVTAEAGPVAATEPATTVEHKILAPEPTVAPTPPATPPAAEPASNPPPAEAPPKK